MSETEPVISSEPTNQQEALPQSETPSFKGTKHKLKVDGKEVELEYDKLVQEASKGYAADKKFREAAQIRQQIEDLFTGLQSKDMNTLKRFAAAVGQDVFRELVENYLLEEIQFEKMPESEKKALAAERRAKQLEEELERTKKTEEERYRADAKQKALQEIDLEIGEALKSFKGKPTPKIVARVVEMLIANLEAKGDRLPASKALERVSKDYEAELLDYLEAMDPTEVRSKLPKKFLEALRKADLDLARGQFPVTKASNQAKPEATKSKVKRMASDEWFQKMESRFSK